MTGFSHTTTGVVIALSVHNPALALPLALASHFVLDALPHYGDDTRDGTDKAFRRFILVDAIAGFSITFLMMYLFPESWLLIGLCGAMSTIPDLMWLPNHVRQVRGQPSKPHNLFMRWHTKIQFEHPVWGIAAEVVWAVGMLSFIAVALFGK
ncbi:MAG: hypothetical protein ACREGD_02365 [Candidatus Saccharimonadales bacterium]